MQRKIDDMITYINTYRKMAENTYQREFIIETIGVMKGIVTAYVGFNEMEEVAIKAIELQNDCYALLR